MVKYWGSVRDYIDVSDLAKAHIKALEYIVNEEKNLIVNLGTEKGTSIFEVIESMEKAIGTSLDYKIVDRRAGDPDSLISDSSKAKTLLDWQAEKSIDEMVKSAWQWQQKYFNK